MRLLGVVQYKYDICKYDICDFSDRTAGFRGGFTLGQGHVPLQIHSLPPDSKASWKNVGLYGVRIFRFRRTDKMDSVMKGLTVQCLPLLEFLD